MRNADILNLIRGSGHSLSSAEESAYLGKVQKLFLHSGAEERRWMDPKFEKPSDFVQASLIEALKDADLPLESVDTFIYASVSRGFHEPAEAFVVAHAAGIRPKHCFDVVEACNSFSRAAHLAQALLKRRSGSECSDYGRRILREWKPICSSQF